MDLGRYAVDAVVFQGRGVREVARSLGRSPAWVSGLVKRYSIGGYEALEPRSRAPKSRPGAMGQGLEDEIVELRKALSESGLDAGPATIHYHLSLRHSQVPSESSIWRALKRRGFVVPQPQKKPRSSWLRFESELPNETWQADVTHWLLKDGSVVEILDFIDDHSRVVVGATVFKTTKAQDVADVFHRSAAIWGYPASCLTDNGAIFNARSRKGRVTFETHLIKLGIEYKHSRPYHPQTCGKIERFHQTLKRWLIKQPLAQSIEELQTQIDWFVNYYNTTRPHRAKARRPPIVSFNAKDKAHPGTPPAKRHVRVRTDKVDSGGTVSLRHNSKLFHIGIGRAYAGQKVRLYIVELEIRVVTMEGELLRRLTLDTAKAYQRQNST